MEFLKDVHKKKIVKEGGGWRHAESLCFLVVSTSDLKQRKIKSSSRLLIRREDEIIKEHFKAC